MKKIFLFLLLNLTAVLFLCGQDKTLVNPQRKAISSLIDQYAQAREKRDTALLKTILTEDVDQNHCTKIQFLISGKSYGLPE